MIMLLKIFNIYKHRVILFRLILLMLCVTIWCISKQEFLAITNDTYNTSQIQKLYLQELQQQRNDTNYYQTINEVTTMIQSSKKSIDNNNETNKIYDNKIPPSLLPNLNFDKTDFNKLINLNNFQFLINQKSCSNKLQQSQSSTYNTATTTLIPPEILILIPSAPNNYKKRLIIRETWGSYNPEKFRLIFLLGAVDTKKEQNQIESENKFYSDIVQGNFHDNYRNMTYKHMMAFKWFIYYCSNAKYLLKVDDDVFVNTPLLDKLIENSKIVNNNNKNLTKTDKHFQNNNLPINDFIFCILNYKSPVLRSYRSKWRVSVKEYANKYYPPYCIGYAILYSSDVVYRLYELGQKSKYFWIDDVHITGTLTQEAKVKITPFDEFSTKLNISRKGFKLFALSHDEKTPRLLWNYLITNDDSKFSTKIDELLKQF